MCIIYYQRHIIFYLHTQIGQWHETLVTIAGITGTVRVDNNAHSVASFSCIPVSPNLDQVMRIGDRFHGQIQQVAINFTPIRLRLEIVCVHSVFQAF